MITPCRRRCYNDLYFSQKEDYLAKMIYTMRRKLVDLPSEQPF